MDAVARELDNKHFCGHLDYISQDFCQYEGIGGGRGLQTGKWDTSQIDLVRDITNIPELNESFDVILCTEVLEHLPEPSKAIDEFLRLLKPAGILTITAFFASMLHFAPYHYSCGFSCYWYRHHLSERGFLIEELTPNDDWFKYLHQELMLLDSMERKHRN